MTENVVGVWVWLGIPLSEFNQNKKAGVCYKCGKPARNQISTLCRGHATAYHRWKYQREKQNEHPLRN